MSDTLITRQYDQSASSILITQRTEELIQASKSANSIRAYRSDWKYFADWCFKIGVEPLPISRQMLGVFIVEESEKHKVSTILRRLSVISEAHKLAGYSSPCDSSEIKLIVKGLKRTKGVAPSIKKPILTSHLESLSQVFGGSLRESRDRALLLLGFTGAFRRSELVALDIADLQFVSEGIIVNVKRSKTDQEGLGTEKAIPYGSQPELCPVRAIKAWIEALQRREGALFVSIGKGNMIHSQRLSDRTVANIIKKYLSQIGQNEKEFSGHSLRAGFVTQAALNGASDRAIMNQTKHRSRAMVDRYVRVATIWAENGATKLGL